MSDNPFSLQRYSVDSTGRPWASDDGRWVEYEDIQRITTLIRRTRQMVEENNVSKVRPECITLPDDSLVINGREFDDMICELHRLRGELERIKEKEHGEAGADAKDR